MAVSQAVADQITQLQAQQAAITNALSAMLQGTWTGAGSVEAYLLALNPTLHFTPKPPDYSVSRPDQKLKWDPDLPQPHQKGSWTCSACALAWVLRATGADPNATEDSEIAEIGEPDNINATYGLMSSAGGALRAVYSKYGLSTSQGWLTFDEAWTLAGRTTGQMSGRTWYHWVALRGQDGPNIWIANSAKGYEGISESLSRADFNRLGPFSVVWLES